MVRLLYKYTDRYDTGIQGSEVVHFDICVDRIFKVRFLKYSLNFQGVSNKIFFFLSTHMEFYPPLFPVPVGISCPLSMHTCLTIVKYFAPKKDEYGCRYRYRYEKWGSRLPVEAVSGTDVFSKGDGG